MRCLDESWPLKEEREGKDSGSLTEAGLVFGGTQATLRAARRLLYLQYDMIGGRQAWRDRIEVVVEKKLFVVHLWTLCQKLLMPQRVEEFGVRRSARYLSMGRRRQLPIRWQRKGLTPVAEEVRSLMKEKMPWASDSLCLKWWVVVRDGVNQYPSHLTTLEGLKRWLPAHQGPVWGRSSGLGFASG